MVNRPALARARCEHGQALVLLVGVLCAILVGAAVLGVVARAVGAAGAQQRAADLAALAGARAMRDVYPRLFEPQVIDGMPNPRHMTRAAYLEIGRRHATAVARANDAESVHVSFPDADPVAPVRIRVAVGAPLRTRARGERHEVQVEASADAQLSPAAGVAGAAAPTGDEYAGPLALRQGKRMRPDVALAFDRLAAAARSDGIHLIIVSAFRSNAEQAVLFAANPDPKWVAPPGTSLHRLGTELDLGPASAYGWLAANAQRFHFLRRYHWEPWHFGYVLNPASAPAMRARRGSEGGEGGGMPSYVPDAYAPALSRAAQRWNVSATLLAAQLQQESGFNPDAVSPAGAQGIAQFMPGTARSYGLANPFDPDAAIDAQAHLMRDLLRQFGAVALALAAYNAGPAPVQRCGCVPPYPETVAYVAAILGRMGGGGDPAGFVGLEVRLVR